MDANFLKLNNEKTEVVLFGLRRQLGKVTLDGLNMCDIIVRSQDVATKRLCVTLGFPDDDDKSKCKRVPDTYTAFKIL